MILYRFVTGWFLENATSEGIEDLLIEGLDKDSMDRMVKVYHESTGGHHFNRFKNYLTAKGVRILEVEQVDVLFTGEG